MEHSPTLNVEAVLLSCLFQPCFENFSRFHFASLEHYASSAERILPAPFAKIDKNIESSKSFDRKMKKERENIIKYLTFGLIMSRHNRKNGLFSAFAAPKFRSYRNYSYLCSRKQQDFRIPRRIADPEGRVQGSWLVCVKNSLILRVQLKAS